MKKVSLVLCAVIIAAVSVAQNPKYIAAMSKNVPLVDSFGTDMQQLSATFKRIGDAEKTEALPYYYAALAKINAANRSQKTNEMGTIATEADSLLAKAKSLGYSNSETTTLEGMIVSLQMRSDPSKTMELGPKSSGLFKKAMEMDATNPRPAMMLAINTFYTPAQFGGGKEKAKELVTLAESLMKSFKPASALHPNWGASMLNGYIKPMVSK